MGKFTRRTLLVGTGLALGAAGAKVIYSEPENLPGDPYPPTDTTESDDDIILNDTSLLNPTRVAKHVMSNSDPDEEFIQELRSELSEARTENRPVVVSAARHTMGGQSLAKDGTVVTLDQFWLEADPEAGVFRVAAGVRWVTVLEELALIGYSPKVMQSNNDFGVASTFCVNAHGWPVPYSAFGSTVRSLKLMLASGDVITCSRNENVEIFNATMGGYGLTGVIIELEVEMVPNSKLTLDHKVMPAREFGDQFVAALKNNPDIQMAYGRLDVTLGNFLEEALLITYTPTENQDPLPPVSRSGLIADMPRRLIFGQIGSDRMKRLRWLMETNMQPESGNNEVMRSELINKSIWDMHSQDPNLTDILHEYFVPPHQFAAFIDACRDVIPSSYQDLLNVTLRYVNTDKESVLSYAREPMIAAVMLFPQELTVRANRDMASMTSQLIERVVAIGGTYYLPYRLDATDRQFQNSYPRVQEFVKMKKSLDPDLLFQNALWTRYMTRL